MLFIQKWRKDRTPLTGIPTAVRIRNSPSAVKRKG
jgi:hypothetical protein